MNGELNFHESLIERVALENSSSAEALISCTEKASATPSRIAITAAALRQGWWRSSCQEKVRSSDGSMAEQASAR